MVNEVKNRHMPALDNQKHEAWARKVALDGKSDLAAYQEAYGCTYDTAHSNACLLRANAGIRARIDELNARTEEKTLMTQHEALLWLQDLITKPGGQITADSPLCNGTKQTQFGTQVLVPDKLAGLKTYAQMRGWMTEKTEHTLKLSIYHGSPDQEKPVIDV